MGARLDAFSNGAGQMAAGAGQRMSSAAAAGKDFAGSMGDVASFSGTMGQKALNIGINMAGNAAQKKISQFQQGLGEIDLSNAGQSIQGGVQSVGSEFMNPGSSGDYRAHEMVGRVYEAGRTIAGELDTLGKVAANAGNTMEPKGLSDGPYGPYQGDFNRPSYDEDERLPGVKSRKKYDRMAQPYMDQKAQDAQDARDKKRKDGQEAGRVKKYGPDKKEERDRKDKERHARERKQRAEGAAKGKAGLEKVLDNPDAPASEDEGYVPPNPGGVGALFDPNAGLTPEQVAQREADAAAADSPEDAPQYTGTNDYNPIRPAGGPFNQDEADFPFGPTEGDPGTTGRPSGPKTPPSSPAAPAAEQVAATSKDPVAPEDKPKTPKKTPKPKSDDKPKPKSKGGRKGGLPKGKLAATQAPGKSNIGNYLDPDGNGLPDMPPQDDNK